MQVSFGEEVFPSFGTALIEQIKIKKSIVLPIATGIIVANILPFYYKRKAAQLSKEAKSSSITINGYSQLQKKIEDNLKKYELFSNIAAMGTAFFAFTLTSIITGKLPHF
jgi:hypothetical protein